MKHLPIVRCSTEEKAKKISNKFDADCVYTGHEPKPWLVIGDQSSIDKLDEFLTLMEGVTGTMNTPVEVI